MGRLAAWDKQGRYDDYFGPLDGAALLRSSAERMDTAIDFLSNVVPSMVAPSLLEGAS